MKKSLLFLLTLLFVSDTFSLAQSPGSLDNSFGTGGSVFVPHSPCRDVKVQQDGKIVVVTSYSFTNPPYGALMRYQANGKMDSAFGIHRIDSLSFGTGKKEASAVEIQQDGKILVAGSYGAGNTMDFMLIRYDTSGNLDSSLGLNGVSLANLGLNTRDSGVSLALQPDGKILLGGSLNNLRTLCRFNANGSLDSAFATNGNFSLPFSGSNAHIRSIALQSDGKIVAGGNVLFRLLTDGTLDSSFGSNGIAVLPGPANDIAIEAGSGKIVMACEAADFLVARFNSDGTLDTSFHHDGIGAAAHTSGAFSLSTSVVIQPDGRIVATGTYKGNLLTRYFALARYDTNGQLDKSFGVNGEVTTSLSGYDQGYTCVYYPNSKILLGGWSDNGRALVRYHLGPMLDVTTISGEEGDITVAPNPTTDLLHITADHLQNGPWYFELTDVAGRLVRSEKAIVVNGMLEKQLSFGEWHPGTYFLSVHNGKRKKVLKIVKQ
jgi:uncharacterized delta-60 repeat protein